MPNAPGEGGSCRRQDEDFAQPMDSAHIQTVVREFLTQRFDVANDRMGEDVSIRDLGLDSMMMLEVMLEVEDRLGVKLMDLSMPANPTLRDIGDLVERNLPGK